MFSRSTELPFLVAHLSLCTENGVALDSEGAGATRRLLYGTLVSSAQILRNLHGHNCPYFIFPDVSVRQRGRYILKITLMRLPRFVKSDNFQSAPLTCSCSSPGSVARVP